MGDIIRKPTRAKYQRHEDITSISTLLPSDPTSFLLELQPIYRCIRELPVSVAQIQHKLMSIKSICYLCSCVTHSTFTSKNRNLSTGQSSILYAQAKLKNSG